MTQEQLKTAINLQMRIESLQRAHKAIRTAIQVKYFPETGSTELCFYEGNSFHTLVQNVHIDSIVEDFYKKISEQIENELLETQNMLIDL